LSCEEREPGSEPFDLTLPDGFELRQHGHALEAAANDAGWTIERQGTIVVVRDVWTENENHAAWLVATRAGLSPERVTVWAGRRPIKGIKLFATIDHSGEAQAAGLVAA
jgi:hypothetical protein